MGTPDNANNNDQALLSGLQSRIKENLSPEIEIINALQESLKQQQHLESVISELEKQRISINNEFNELKSQMHKQDEQK